MSAVAKIETSEGEARSFVAALVSDPGEESTVALVEAARAGDRRAFARLYRKYGRVVHGVLLARLPRTELRDAMQEVFALALAKLDGLREPASFGSWLAAIARNLARDWFKRHGNTRELAHEPGHFEQRGGGDLGAGGDGQQALADALSLLGALGELPEDYRELLVLRFVEGLSGPEIAAALDMTPGSVRVKLHRGVSRLRARIGGGHE